MRFACTTWATAETVVVSHEGSVLLLGGGGGEKLFPQIYERAIEK